jgi:hypothetical protein
VPAALKGAMIALMFAIMGLTLGWVFERLAPEAEFVQAERTASSPQQRPSLELVARIEHPR